MPPTAPQPASARTQADDQELLPYVLSAEIGKGSFATVYRGYHEVTREQVAIKSVSRSILTTKLFENLQSEIEILKRLSHKHVTQLIDIIRAERNIYLIMEFCKGGDLSGYIKKRGKVEGLAFGSPLAYWPHPKTGGLDVVVVRAFLRQLARALKFLRYHNLIHRDIKPQNLLLTPAAEEDYLKGHPIGVPLLKLADFGFARVLPNATLAETLCGSPLYMAPEILRYEKYDAKADLWSVGGVLYEMSVGRPPFRAQNHIELLKRIEHAKDTIKFPDEDPEKAATVISVPEDLKELIRALLKRKPVERAGYDEFWKSRGLEMSKFRRPSKRSVESILPTDGAREVEEAQDSPAGEPWVVDSKKGIEIPEGHKIIPQEILDPKVNIPPSTFYFRHNPSMVRKESPRMRAIQLEHRQSQGYNSPPQPSSPREDRQNNQAEDKEYVLVDDKGSVEFNKRVDELNSYRHPALGRTRKAPPSPLGGRMLELAPEVALSESPVNQQGSPREYPPIATHTPPSPGPAFPQSLSGNGTSGRSASNALSRALNMASNKLFGGGSKDQAHPSSTGRRQISADYTREEAERAREDESSDALLKQLEDLAQKTAVIMRWCDDLFAKLTSTPISPSRARRAVPDPDCSAVTCITLYMLLMSFAQRGVDSIRQWSDFLRSGGVDVTLGEGFNDALAWFRDLFLKCQERVMILRVQLPKEFGAEAQSVQSLIYNHAVTLSRAAARKELLDQMSSNDECEKLYEEALWSLYAVRDDISHAGVTGGEEEHDMLQYTITRTKLRLHRCRMRMKMNDQERIKDARADYNLDDVQRFPPPWEMTA